MLKNIKIFGLSVVDSTSNEVFNEVIGRAINKKKTVINYANAHTINLSYKKRSYYEFLKKSDIIYPDGIAVVLSSKLKKEKINQRVTLTNTLIDFCNLVKKNGLKIYFLGAEETVINNAINIIRKRCGEEIVAGHHCGYFTDSNLIVNLINDSKADVLMVGMGSPHQEIWIENNHSKIEAPVLWAVGGLFDFYGGKTALAPDVIQKINLEWFWRMVQEPKRLWKRYILGNPMYIYRTIVEWIFPRS